MSKRTNVVTYNLYNTTATSSFLDDCKTAGLAASAESVIVAVEVDNDSIRAKADRLAHARGGDAVGFAFA